MMSDVIARLKEHQTPTPSKWREWRERGFFNQSLVYLRKNSELCRVELRPRPTLPSTHPRFCAYSCAIEVRLMCVCCPFVNRTTIEQQSDNNRTTM